MSANDAIHLDKGAIEITEHCTLNCELCIAYTPYIDNPKEISFEEIKKLVDRYFQLVSSVGTFNITGGEPLLHKNLASILEYVANYFSQIRESLDLVTNGTLGINADVLDFYRRYREKARVIISDYGDKSPKIPMLIESLNSIGMSVRIEHYHGDNILRGGWVDLRDHSLKHLPDTDINDLPCHLRNRSNYVIRSGALWYCTPSKWRMQNGIIPFNKDEFIDLLDDNQAIDDQKAILRGLLKKGGTTSCFYCAGVRNDGPRYVPARQVKN